MTPYRFPKEWIDAARPWAMNKNGGTVVKSSTEILESLLSAGALAEIPYPTNWAICSGCFQAVPIVDSSDSPQCSCGATMIHTTRGS